MATTGVLSYSERAQSSKAHGINENKKFTGFLGGIQSKLTDDLRCELFVSQLRATATANKIPERAYSEGQVIRPALQDRYSLVQDMSFGDVKFNTLLDWMIPNNEMYNDWLLFFCQLAYRLNNKPITQIDGSLDFIKGIHDIPDPGERMFAIALVKVFVKDLTADGSSVRDNYAKWDSVTGGRYWTRDEILENLFSSRKVYTSPNAGPIPGEGPVYDFYIAVKNYRCYDLTTPRVFNKYNYEKYCKRLLDNTMAEVRAEVDRVIAPETHTEELNIASIPILQTLAGTQPVSTPPSEKYRYIRKEDKKLYIITSDGKETPATEFKSSGKTTIQSTCTAAGFTNDAQCDEFFFSCITGRNLGGCSKFLSDKKFWVTGKFEFLDTVNLYIAHLALEKYQIPRSVKNGLKMYDFDGWATVLDEQQNVPTSGLNAAAVKSIKENGPLMELLKVTTERINMFPAILNEDYITGPTQQEVALPTSSSLTMAFLTGRPNPYASQPPVSIPKGTLSELITGKVDQTKAIIQKILQNFHRMVPHLQSRMVGVPGVFPGVFPGVLGLHGGADPVDPYKTWGIGSPAPSSLPITYGSNAGYNYNFYKDHVKTKELLNLLQGGLPSWLESTFNTRFAGLEEKGYKMADSDKKSILKVVEYVKKIEKTLLMALHSFAKYGFFMESDLIPFLLSHSTDDPKWTSDMNGLMNLHTKTAGDMIKIVELTEKQLGTYCKKVGGLGGVCSTLTDQIALLK